MLRISKLADYATIVMVYMAHMLGVHNARDIAMHTHIALPTVSKILKLMAQKGLVVSQRGVKGGYSLAKDPEQISMADILSAIDGDLRMTDCHVPGSCSLEPICAVRSNWSLLSHAIFKSLSELSLATMAKPIQAAKFNLMNSATIASLQITQ
jgi:FeS assembly SUF system regulator